MKLSIIDICPYCMKDTALKTHIATKQEQDGFGIIIDHVLECQTCKGIWTNSHQIAKFKEDDNEISSV